MPQDPMPAPEQDESAHMQDVDQVAWGPTEPDEEAVLSKLYGYDPETGSYLSHVGD